MFAAQSGIFLGPERLDYYAVPDPRRGSLKIYSILWNREENLRESLPRRSERGGEGVSGERSKSNWVGLSGMREDEWKRGDRQTWNGKRAI